MNLSMCMEPYFVKIARSTVLLGKRFNEGSPQLDSTGTQVAVSFWRLSASPLAVCHPPVTVTVTKGYGHHPSW